MKSIDQIINRGQIKITCRMDLVSVAEGNLNLITHNKGNKTVSVSVNGKKLYEINKSVRLELLGIKNSF